MMTSTDSEAKCSEHIQKLKIEILTLGVITTSNHGVFRARESPRWREHVPSQEEPAAGPEPEEVSTFKVSTGVSEQVGGQYVN